jgi:structural maintenance of chromosomes protein 5
LSRKAEEVTAERAAPLTNVKEIILENFMSYEYARIPLKEGLNLIVGPNGAGKSSILLAISVAFGQAYTERSRKLSDLIRRGKDIARVSLVFDNTPKGGKRPIPYSKSDTFMLSRYLRKDGSYWFEADYREIEKSEVVRLLREFGINPDNLLIIMHQGMIEELGSVTPQERLKMVEEAVGFSEFRQRILAAEQELSGLIGEESSLLQLIDNANQALEYWKQIYERFQEKKKLMEHRDLLQKELLWSTEAKLSKSLAAAEEKIQTKKANLDDMTQEQKQIGEDAEATRRGLLDKQVELRKLYGALIRAEKERSKDEGAGAALAELAGDLAGLSKTVDELAEPQSKNVKRLKELSEYITRKGTSGSEDATRRKSELDREVSSLQPEIGRTEEAVSKTTDSYISLRVKFEVLGFRIKSAESELRDLERSAREYREELEKLAPDLEKSGPRVDTQRQPYEVSEELKLASAHLQKMQDVPDEAEKIYNDYSGNVEELKVKLAQLQDNKKVMLTELQSRKGVWKEAMNGLLQSVDPAYQSILAAADAKGFVKFEEGGGDIDEAGIDLYVGFRGSAPTTLDPFTQSGGERSVALMAFTLSLQSRIVSPLRAMDEFDIHMDPKNREAMFKMILTQMKLNGASQYMVITPSVITVFDMSAHVVTVQAVHGASEIKELKGK